MVKKLTFMGALMALVLGTFAVFQGSASAAKIQNFDVTGPFAVTYDYCYGGAYPSGALACGAGSSDTYAGTPGATVAQYQVISLPGGDRLTLPISFAQNGPNGFNAPAFACMPVDLNNECTAAPAVGNDPAGVITADIQAESDILCDSNADILARSSTDATGEHSTAPTKPWPKGDSSPTIHGFDTHRIAASVADGGNGVPAASSTSAYVSTGANAIEPFPAGYTFRTMDRANFTNLWLSGLVPFTIPTTPLVSVAYDSNLAGVTGSVALLGGDPGTPPDNSYTCLDSPQNSIAATTITLPATTGDYVRWTQFTSAADDRSGDIQRVLDVRCVHVGPTAVTPVCNYADADGDGVPAAIETILGTSDTNADADADGSTDYDEMFSFTNPAVADTDGDGSKDKQDNGADEVPGTSTTVDDTTADDNCPAKSNPSQDNTDSQNDLTASPPAPITGARTDNTNPHQDIQGDACDADDDNDGTTDVAELQLQIKTTGKQATAPFTYCVGPGTAGAIAPAVAQDPLNADSDQDLGLDGQECRFSARPDLATGTNARYPVAAAGEDGDGDGLFEPCQGAGACVGGSNTQAESYYRTQFLSQDNADPSTPNNNPDGDANNAGTNDTDSDNDTILDGVEVKFYATNPTNPDTDGDGCTDGKEVSDINGSRGVNATDLGQVAARFGSYRNAGTGVVDPLKVDYDFDKNGNINATDLGRVAANFGNCSPIPQGGHPVSSFPVTLNANGSVDQTGTH
jgi:hypothetical protein